MNRETEDTILCLMMIFTVLFAYFGLLAVAFYRALVFFTLYGILVSLIFYRLKQIRNRKVILRE